MPDQGARKISDSEKKSNLVFLPTPGFTSKSEGGWGRTKPQRLLCVCSSLTKYKNMLCWLIRTASPVTHLKGFEIVSLHVFSLNHPIVHKNCFLICVFHAVRLCCSCHLKELTGHERGRAILQETSLSDKDVQSPFTEKEKESMSKLWAQQSGGKWMVSPWEKRVSYILCSARARVVAIIQSLSHVQLFVTPLTAACQASLSFTISWSLLKLTSIELMMPLNHLILSYPLIFLPLIFASISSSHQVAKVLEL